MSRGPAIIAFARAPVPGHTKTRLIPALGAEGAAALYQAFLLDTLELLSSLPATLILAAAALEDRAPLRALLSANGLTAELTVQQGGDLGARISQAFTEALAQGFGPVVIVGTDAPDLPREQLMRALDLLNNHDAVFGPCADGGYYLVGLREPQPELFQGIAWSSGEVLEQTRTRGHTLGLSVALLEEWSDVDTPEDLAALQERLTRAGASEDISCPRTWEYFQAHTPEVSESASRLTVIIPALNEEQSIGRVLEAIPSALEARVIVVDNGSTDRTAEIAAQHGATVIREPQRGYGAACLAGLAAIAETDIIAFLDADFSDDPALLVELVRPIQADRADFVIGSRMLGLREPGALPLHSRFGNWLAGVILTHLYGQPTTDLGPFRAIRWNTLQQLQMADRGFGWTMEMQAKAARLGVRTVEIPVPYRKRIGRSKITGSLKASAQAAVIILWTAFRLLRWRPGDASTTKAPAR